jgi:hypothetical protein
MKPLQNTSTYLSAFKLYSVSIFKLMPFALFYAAGSSLINVFFPFAENFSRSSLFLFKYAALQVPLFIFSLSLMLNGCYLIYNDDEVNCLRIVQRSILRFIPNMVVVFVMVILLFIFASLGLGLAALSKASIDLMIISVFVATGVSIAPIMYFLLSPMLITVFERTILNAMKESYELVNGKWFSTLLLVVTVVLCKILLTILLELATNFRFSGEIVDVFLVPLSACLLMIHYTKLSGTRYPLRC